MRERCETPGTTWAKGIHVPHASTVTNDSSTLTPTLRTAPRRAHHCSADLRERFGSVAAGAVVCQPLRSTNRAGHSTLGRACGRAQRMSDTGSHPRSRMPAPEAWVTAEAGRRARRALPTRPEHAPCLRPTTCLLLARCETDPRWATMTCF